MCGRHQLVSDDECLGQARCRTETVSEGPVGKVLDLFFMRRAVRTENTAAIGETKNRLNTARNIAGQQRNGAGRRNRSQAAIAQSVLGNAFAHKRVQPLHIRPGEKGLLIIKRERAFLGCEIGAGGIG